MRLLRLVDARVLGAVAIAAVTAVGLHGAGQGPGQRPSGEGAGGGRAAGPPAPITRTRWDGKPDFSGVWLQAMQVDRDPERGNLNLLALDRLYKPEVRAMREALQATDSPDYHCAPQSYPMAMPVPHPIQMVQTPGMMLVLTEYLHGFRAIPTDGRPHDPSAKPSHVGESVGHWEGDTLVVDVTRFNGKQWLALAQQSGAIGGRGAPAAAPQGASGSAQVAPGVGGYITPQGAGLRQNAWPGSDAMHIVERWSLVDGDTLEYQSVVEDPKMLIGPWTSAKMHRGKLKYDLIQEDVCIDDAIERNLLEKYGDPNR
ncbi:MAG TPA: hypothetical protein VFU28_07615 [Vicinamibacterales bacterium]|nr:hypothetical protein [Vicinamibacterales bacterium]